MIQYQRALETWQTLSHELFEPTTESEYTALLEFTRRLSSEHSIDREPIKTLFWLACEYLRRWEKTNDPWAKEPVTPREWLEHLMGERKLKQQDLSSVVSQSNLSRILRGERRVGAATAKKLGAFFGVNPSVFL
jgi:HTH-type transcriptional regulator / antitoxin HigA